MALIRRAYSSTTSSDPFNTVLTLITWWADTERCRHPSENYFWKVLCCDECNAFLYICENLFLCLINDVLFINLYRGSIGSIPFIAINFFPSYIYSGYNWIVFLGFVFFSLLPPLWHSYQSGNKIFHQAGKQVCWLQTKDNHFQSWIFEWNVAAVRWVFISVLFLLIYSAWS